MGPASVGPAMAAVEVDGLTVRYGDVIAVDGVSLRGARPGRSPRCSGPNGAGKTTTVEVLEGFRRPDAGRTLGARPRPAGRPRRAHPPGGRDAAGGRRRARACGCCEALRHAAALYDDAARPGDAARAGRAHRHRAAHLAADLRRRAAPPRPRARAGRPPAGRVPRRAGLRRRPGRAACAIREVVAGLRDDGVTVVLTTHDLDEAERLADHVVILDHGRVRGGRQPRRRCTTGAAVAEVRFGAPRRPRRRPRWRRTSARPVTEVERRRVPGGGGGHARPRRRPHRLAGRARPAARRPARRPPAPRGRVPPPRRPDADPTEPTPAVT